jgi:enterochelin esterase family protein
VDGITVADPNNMEAFPNERFKSSLVDIPSAPPATYSIQDVPHGEVTHCYYKSTAMKVTRPLLVYTPPGYRQGIDHYPVSTWSVAPPTLKKHGSKRAGQISFSII